MLSVDVNLWQGAKLKGTAKIYDLLAAQASFDCKFTLPKPVSNHTNSVMLSTTFLVVEAEPDSESFQNYLYI